uniref:hypothetical protein n=1 Tax=Yersinia thracica TaxID=2890319 RepID=UPI001C98A88C
CFFFFCFGFFFVFVYLYCVDFWGAGSFWLFCHLGVCGLRVVWCGVCLVFWAVFCFVVFKGLLGCLGLLDIYINFLVLSNPMLFFFSLFVVRYGVALCFGVGVFGFEERGRLGLALGVCGFV